MNVDMLKALEGTVNPTDLKTIANLLSNKGTRISSSERQQLISRLSTSLLAQPKNPNRKPLKDMTEEEKEECREEIRQRLKDSQTKAPEQLLGALQDKLGSLMEKINLSSDSQKKK